MTRGFYGVVHRTEDGFTPGEWGSFCVDESKRVQLMPGQNKQSFHDGMLIGTVRLDYRDELGDKLGIRYRELQFVSDDELLVRAYQKWGKQCVMHLEGDWSFAVMDITAQELVLSKEPSGISALFYLEHEDGFYFASDTRVFERLVQRAMQWNEPYVQSLEDPLKGFIPGATADLGIRYVMCGEQLVVCRYGHHKRVFDDLLHVPVSLHYHMMHDHVLRFRSVMAEAVRQRYDARRTTGLFLSGGLDSGSICALLAEESALLNQPVYTYTAVPAYPEELSEQVLRVADESAYAQRYAEVYPHVVHSALSFKGDAVVSNHIHLRIEDVFYPVINKNTFWLNGILRMAKERGVERMFQGQTGNYTISWNAPRDRSGMDSRSARIDILSRTMTFTGMRWYQDGWLAGVEVVEPTVDNRLVRHSLSIPEECFHYKGKQKYIVREAMKGLVPEVIRVSQQVFFQSCDFVAHLKRDTAAMKNRGDEFFTEDAARVREELIRYSLHLFKSAKKK